MAEMKSYRITVQRTDRYIAHVYVEGDSEEDAAERFKHQLESNACSQIEDTEMWGEAYYYQIVKASPYNAEYEVLETELDEED